MSEDERNTPAPSSTGGFYASSTSFVLPPSIFLHNSTSVSPSSVPSTSNAQPRSVPSTSNVQPRIAPSTTNVHQRSAPSTSNVQPRSVPNTPNVQPRNVPSNSNVQLRSVQNTPNVQSRSVPSTSNVQSRSAPSTSNVQPRSAPSTSNVQPRSVPSTSNVQSRSVPSTSNIQSRNLPNTPNVQPRSVPNTPNVQPRSVPNTPNVHQRSAPSTSSVQPSSAPSTSNVQPRSAPSTSSVQLRSAPSTSSVQPSSAPSTSNVQPRIAPSTSNGFTVQHLPSPPPTESEQEPEIDMPTTSMARGTSSPSEENVMNRDTFTNQTAVTTELNDAFRPHKYPTPQFLKELLGQLFCSNAEIQLQAHKNLIFWLEHYPPVDEESCQVYSEAFNLNSDNFYINDVFKSSMKSSDKTTSARVFEVLAIMFEKNFESCFEYHEIQGLLTVNWHHDRPQLRFHYKLEGHLSQILEIVTSNPEANLRVSYARCRLVSLTSNAFRNNLNHGKFDASFVVSLAHKLANIINSVFKDREYELIAAVLHSIKVVWLKALVVALVLSQYPNDQSDESSGNTASLDSIVSSLLEPPIEYPSTPLHSTSNVQPTNEPNTSNVQSTNKPNTSNNHTRNEPNTSNNHTRNEPNTSNNHTRNVANTSNVQPTNEPNTSNSHTRNVANTSTNHHRSAVLNARVLLEPHIEYPSTPLHGTSNIQPTNELSKSNNQPRNEHSTSNNHNNQPRSAGINARGFNLKKRNHKGETILHTTCIKNDVKTLRKLLAMPNINVNVTDHNGWTPLHEACNHGFYECVELLLQSPGIDMQARSNDEGITPLIDAVNNGRVDVCRLLMRYGGRQLLHDRNSRGFTALDVAESEGNTKIISVLLETLLQSNYMNNN